MKGRFYHMGKGEVYWGGRLAMFNESDFNKYKSGLKELEYISKEAGAPVYYTQGGGGNTSVKLDEQYMAVKASGYKLKQITPDVGYVIVDYRRIKDYYCNVDISMDNDFEKESADMARRSVKQAQWLKVARPSVEAGFHSLLDRCVIHTHSVYANILTCIKNGCELVGEIFGSKGYNVVWIPYINPGFCLTLKIKEAIGECVRRTGREPEVVFMENHGLIVASDCSFKAVEIHNKVNDEIKEYLGITDDFPDVSLSPADGETIISATAYIKDFIKSGNLGIDFFDDVVLYPDQFVYLNDSVAYNHIGNKLNIFTDTGEVIYKTNFTEAETMEETLLASLYVVNEIKKRSLSLKTMTKKDIDFIRNWESEAYRKSLVKGLKPTP